jgi:hypothetical protein
MGGGEFVSELEGSDASLLEPSTEGRPEGAVAARGSPNLEPTPGEGEPMISILLELALLAFF